MTEAIFSRRGVVLAVAVLSISFLSFLIWSVFGDEIKSIESSQADSFSPIRDRPPRVRGTSW